VLVGVRVCLCVCLFLCITFMHAFILHEYDTQPNFESTQLPKFGMKFVDGLVFSLFSVRCWMMVFLTVLSTLLCSPGDLPRAI